MIEVYRHNPNLPLPKEVFDISPSAVLLDGVHEAVLHRGTAFGTPSESVLEWGFKQQMLPTSLAPEIICQAAAYIVSHGSSIRRAPMLLEVERLGWKIPIWEGQQFGVEVHLDQHTTDENVYAARGVISVDGERAAGGYVKGTFLDYAGVQLELEPQAAPIEELEHPGTGAELYERLVELSQIPENSSHSTLNKADLAITSDKSIQIDNTPITLRPHELFLLNVLLLNRTSSVTWKDFLEAGFAPKSVNDNGRIQAFNAAKKRLKRSLVTRYGVELFESKYEKMSAGRRLRYQLNPEVDLVLSDKRPNATN